MENGERFHVNGGLRAQPGRGLVYESGGSGRGAPGRTAACSQGSEGPLGKTRLGRGGGEGEAGGEIRER